jgi:hypothetical protein
MTSLVTGQIVFLQCRQTRLYAEVIQVLETRRRGWIRPLALVSQGVTQLLDAATEGEGWFRSAPTTPDMVWPLTQLQPALDTDVIPLLASLATKPRVNDGTAASLETHQISQAINDFARQLWADSQSEDAAAALGKFLG